MGNEFGTFFDGARSFIEKAAARHDMVVCMRSGIQMPSSIELGFAKERPFFLHYFVSIAVDRSLKVMLWFQCKHRGEIVWESEMYDLRTHGDAALKRFKEYAVKVIAYRCQYRKSF